MSGLLDRCVTCFMVLDTPENFPEDFPDEWKMCCVCYCYAEEIIEKGGVEKVIFTWNGLGVSGITSRLVDTLYKIERKINVN